MKSLPIRTSQTAKIIFYGGAFNLFNTTLADAPEEAVPDAGSFLEKFITSILIDQYRDAKRDFELGALLEMSASKGMIVEVERAK